MRPLLFVLMWVAGCGPRDVIPAGPDHPADPQAAAGAAPAADVPDAAPAPDAGHDDHAGHPPPPAKQDPAALAAAEQAAIDRAMPVFRRHCAGCHTSKGEEASKKKLDHFDMDRYPFGGHHADELGAAIRKVLGLSGGKATMPKDDPGAVTGEELQLVHDWSRAFDRAHAAGLHQQPEDHGHQGHHH